jgi:Fe-S-cluster-containing hydrogenase component 2
LKNQIGCLPGGQKTMTHRLGSTPERFGHLIVDLYTVIRPKLALMDAVIGLGGSWRPSDRLAPGLILAGEDPVAVDAVAAHIGGFDPAEVPMLRFAAERGLGIIEVDTMDFPGLHVDEIRPVPLLPHRFSSRLRSHAISFLSQPFLARQRPRVNREECNGCAHCLEVCPAEAVLMEDSHPVFLLDACIRCFCCHELCPQRAIAVDWGFPGNLFIRHRQSPRQSFTRS